MQANFVQHKMDPRAPAPPAPLPQSAGKFDGMLLLLGLTCSRSSFCHVTVPFW